MMMGAVSNSNQRQPLGISLAATVNLIEIQRLQALGDRAAPTSTDGAAVYLADRGHFGGGAGKERFVGNVHLIAGDTLFFQWNPQVGGEPEDEGTSAKAIEKQLNASLKRLKTDYIDLYYLHRFDGSVSQEEILRALQKAVYAGKIRYYGVSNYSAEQLRALLTAADELNLPRPVVCQPPLSMLKQDALSELIPLCASEDIAVIPYQIYQGGLLTGKYKRGMEPPKGSRAEEKPAWLASPDDALYDKLEAIEAGAKARGISMSAYALRWTLEQPAVVSAIVGVKSEKQVDDAIAAIG